MKLLVENTILTKDMPSNGGSKMLDGYMSLFDAEVISKLKEAGVPYEKVACGEMGVDFVGETSIDGFDGVYQADKALADGDFTAAVTFDVNGAPRRGAALSGDICLKPSYGIISRYGTIAAACSGECVSINAKTADAVEETLKLIAGHDAKDGTSQTEAICNSIKEGTFRKDIKKIAIAKSLVDSADADVKAKLEEVKSVLGGAGIEFVEVDDSVIATANVFWNFLMSAEVCNNVSRFDGVKYGYRSANYTTIGELYTNSRTEAFGFLLKEMILLGSEALSEDNYFKVYDKGLRMRGVIIKEFFKIFAECDAVIMPTTSKLSYSIDEMKAGTCGEVAYKMPLAFTENKYTAPASITGLPSITFGGISVIAGPSNDLGLIDLARTYEKEAK